MTAVEDDETLCGELSRAGFECFEEKTSFRRYRHRLDPLMVLDVMRVSAGTFRKMWEASQPFDLDGIDLRVPALAHLIALKLHAAQNEHRTNRDMADVLELLTANPGKIGKDELARLCDQFGTPALAAQLHAFL